MDIFLKGCIQKWEKVKKKPGRIRTHDLFVKRRLLFRLATAVQV